MRKIIFSILFLCSLSQAAFSETSILESMFKASESIVTVQSGIKGIVQDQGLKIVQYGSVAAGMVIDENGLIVLNAHSVRLKQAGKIKVTLNSGETFDGQLLRIVPEHDIAFIKINVLKKIPAMELANSAAAKLNMAVYTIGTSSVSKDSFSQGKIIGIVQSKQKNDGTSEMFQISFSAYKGDSGSPLINREGQLLGILSAAQVGRSGSSFAIPSNIIRKYRDELARDHI